MVDGAALLDPGLAGVALPDAVLVDPVVVALLDATLVDATFDGRALAGTALLGAAFLVAAGRPLPARAAVFETGELFVVIAAFLAAGAAFLEAGAILLAAVLLAAEGRDGLTFFFAAVALLAGLIVSSFAAIAMAGFPTTTASRERVTIADGTKQGQYPKRYRKGLERVRCSGSATACRILQAQCRGAIVRFSRYR